MSYRRNARHDQRAIPTGTVCSNCQKGICQNCVDIPRMVAGYFETVCSCRRSTHSVEPRDRQISDPDSGIVYAPGMSVLQDGTVVRE